MVGYSCTSPYRSRERKKEIVNIRDIQDTDIQFIFNIANAVDIRKVSFCSQTISWDTHIKWFNKQKLNGNPFYIISYDDHSCGYIRMDRSKFTPQHDYIVSIAVTNEYRRKGIALTALRAACKQVLTSRHAKKLWALVKNDNLASNSLFIKAFWKETRNPYTFDRTTRYYTYPCYAEL